GIRDWSVTGVQTCALPIFIKEAPSEVNRRIADRVRELRAAHGLSLDALAGRSGVSRSMISLIERGESSPTAVVLEKLAAGLGVKIGRASCKGKRGELGGRG